MQNLPLELRESTYKKRGLALMLLLLLLEILAIVSLKQSSDIYQQEKNEGNKSKLGLVKSVLYLSLLSMVAIWLHKLMKISKRKKDKDGKQLCIAGIVLFFFKGLAGLGCLCCGIGDSIELETWVYKYSDGSRRYETRGGECKCFFYIIGFVFLIYACFVTFLASLAFMLLYVVFKFQFIDKHVLNNYIQTDGLPDPHVFVKQRMFNKQIIDAITLEYFIFCLPQFVAFNLSFTLQTNFNKNFTYAYIVIFSLLSLVFLYQIVDKFFINPWDHISKESIELYQTLLEQNDQNEKQNLQQENDKDSVQIIENFNNQSEEVKQDIQNINNDQMPVINDDQMPVINDDLNILNDIERQKQDEENQKNRLDQQK